MNTEIREQVLHLGGDITVKTVSSAAYERFEQQCRLKEVHTLDLTGVAPADSACLSLLLSALRLKQGAITLRHIPASVLALAELYEIDTQIARHE